MILLEIYDPYGPKDKKELTQSEDLLNLQPFEIWKFGDYSCDRLSGLRKNLHFNL